MGLKYVGFSAVRAFPCQSVTGKYCVVVIGTGLANVEATTATPEKMCFLDTVRTPGSFGFCFSSS